MTSRPPIARHRPDGVGGLIRCPVCGAGVNLDDPIQCDRCRTGYELRDGIPLLVAPSSGAGHDEHKALQADYFEYDDPAASEYEITRPHGTPALHSWLLEEKFRRGTSSLVQLIPGCSALVVCGGSGMDAEFLEEARAGMIVSCDLSLGATLRSRERARRFRLSLIPIVADVERLPFGDRSFDLVYVHDGLHHLEEPERGIAEMMRVADRAISINEPARALATAVAVRAGISTNQEEAGNPVARLEPDRLERLLGGGGFSVTHSERYAMFYRHRAGLPVRALSGSVSFAAGRGGWRFVNALLGRFGNKLTVQAIRDP